MTEPFAQFSEWLEAAKACKEISEPTAMALATATKDAIPSVRIVLLKGIDERGFVFYTNMASRKSRELIQNPMASVCFHWMPLSRQVRVGGIVERVSDAEADAYFASRPRESQIGAWASQQSEPLASHAALEQAVKEVEKRFEGKEVLRPPHWSGWRLIPQEMEFWQQGKFRLHHREVFIRTKDGWDQQLLYP
ncbi:MAG: pyridoxamine 5'-phosphate oxidase [Alphaproteobacteria bacterium]|nr:pyridoxamine 5'-phosphate oxidase [Alphaproteobacteria bacterium]